MANTKFLALVALFATVAVAQDSSASAASSAPAAVPSIDTCILGCVTPAAVENGCVSFANVSCVCTSQPFQAAALACLQANCTAADVTASEALQTAQCANVAGAPNASAPASSGSAGASSPPSPSASGSGAAPAPSSLAVAFGPQAIWGLAAASVGLAMGALV
ncbi:hypothetical protein BDN72DRAFT_959341 [Pluteus cervinus]|uniref:Uncharacterized protein n=1 Tax=Pluteus cervinus TaxID=181527 RepID=A0ACD3AWL4_9AGAR|nr:hypothetical protein BDN72DRAFT_959341 [Pluteus cervinus]